MLLHPSSCSSTDTIYKHSNTPVTSNTHYISQVFSQPCCPMSYSPRGHLNVRYKQTFSGVQMVKKKPGITQPPRASVKNIKLYFPCNRSQLQPGNMALFKDKVLEAFSSSGTICLTASGMDRWHLRSATFLRLMKESEKRQRHAGQSQQGNRWYMWGVMSIWMEWVPRAQGERDKMPNKERTEIWN